MSNKKRKARPKIKNTARPRSTISIQQDMRLQQAYRAHAAGNLEFAEAAYRALITENVKLPQIFNNLALICAGSARPKEARSLWKKALAIEPRFSDARMHLASAYEQSGELDRAARTYQRLLSDQPQMHIARYQFANLLKAQGDIVEATAHYEQIMQQQPAYTQAHFTYSGVHKYRDSSDPHIEMMLGLYQKKNLPAENRIHLAFALAKAYEDFGEYREAFGYLEEGNRLRAATFNYGIEGDEALTNNIIETFTREAMGRVNIEAEQSDRPIFIVGMPRSGTSLVEKILASHSDVHGAGELDYLFAMGVNEFLRESANFGFKPLGSYDSGKFVAAGKTYLEKINRLNQQAGHITDKLPMNFMMIGLIKMALPNAKIIHCVRDARDTCLSIYKQNFNTGNYRFAYDLKSVAQFHKLYRKMMDHWHQVMPGAIYDIEYEQLTQNPEIEIRNLLSACELEFEENCLQFDRSEALVRTASFYQVRQPMYTSSVKLWEHYREFLGPLFDELGYQDQGNTLKT